MKKSSAIAAFGATATIAIGTAILSSQASVIDPGPQEISVGDMIVDCSMGKDMILPHIQLSVADIEDYYANTKFVGGIPLVKYDDGKGEQINPWTVSYIALSQLAQYCEDGDEERLAEARYLRDWLSKDLRLHVDKRGVEFLRVEYTFANLPYAAAPMWGSAFAQSSVVNLMLRIRPADDTLDAARILSAVRAFTIPIEDDGLYSDYENGSIFWEEVATTEGPSLVINGHFIATYYVAQIANRINDTTLMSEVQALNERAIQAGIVIKDRLIVDKDVILYDFSQPQNTRQKGHYAHELVVEGYDWLRRLGRVSWRDVNLLKRLDAPALASASKVAISPQPPT